jgi:hypothetical protein
VRLDKQRSGRPGGFLEEEYRRGLRRYRRRVLPKLILIVLPFILAALLLSVLGQGIWRWDGGVLLGAGVAMFVGFLQSPPAYIERKANGALGEQRTAKVLRRLERDGWHAAHDLERQNNGNIDHLLIGPRGVFIIDSKFWGGIARVDEAGVITVTAYDDNSITWTSRDHRSKTHRTKGVVVRALVRRTGKAVPEPVLVVVFWSRFPQREVEANGITYVAGEHLVDWLRTYNKVTLSRSQVAQLAAAATPDLLTAAEDQ